MAWCHGWTGSLLGSTSLYLSALKDPNIEWPSSMQTRGSLKVFFSWNYIDEISYVIIRVRSRVKCKIIPIASLASSFIVFNIHITIQTAFLFHNPTIGHYNWMHLVVACVNWCHNAVVCRPCAAVPESSFRQMFYVTTFHEGAPQPQTAGGIFRSAAVGGGSANR